MSWERLLRALAAPLARRRALRALAYGKGDLGIDWPVYILWRRGLAARGRASSGRKHAIELRAPHEPREAERTVLHELYHLAQFHKWGDLDPRRRRLSPADLERADCLAELYARLTAKAMRRRRG